ncbi:MAG: zinc ribbon domain-containing protein [Candidatus Methanomethylicaceae archaeon]
MYCTYCGAKNPDDFRFCRSCGKPNPVQGVSPSSSSSDVTYIRKAFISAAYAFLKGGSRKGAQTPFDLLEPNWTDRAGFLKNPTTQEVHQLVLLWHFDEQDKEFLSNNPEVLVNYLYMVGSLNSPLIQQGALLAQALLLYNSSLKGFAEERDWKAYDESATQYLNDAREVGEPFYLLEPLVKVAYGKLMLNDRPTAREYLDEFYRIVDRASQRKPAYFGDLDDAAFNMWVYGCRKQADELRRKI